MCNLRFQKEKSEQEVNLYRLGLWHRKLPPSFNTLEQSFPITMLTLRDSLEYEDLSKQYFALIQRTKSEFITILTKVVDLKKSEFDKKFDMTMISLWNQQCTLPINEQLTATMVQLIDEREKNIIQCVKHICILKTNFFHTLQIIQMKNKEHV